MWITLLNYACVAGNALLCILTYTAFTRKRPPRARVVLFIVAYTAVLGYCQPPLGTINLAYSAFKAVLIIGASVILFQSSFATAGCLLLVVRLVQAVGDGLAALVLLVGRCYRLEQVHASITLLMVVQLLRWAVIGLLLFAIYRFRSPDGPPRAATPLTRFVLPGSLAIATYLAIANYTIAPDLLRLPRHALAINCLTGLYCSLGALAFIPVAYSLEAQGIDNKHLRFHLSTCEQLAVELRGFRHNCRNILHGLGGLIEHNDWDGLKAYFAEVAADSQRIAARPSNSSLLLIHHRPLFGLLSEKMQAAEALGVPLYLQAEQAVEKLPLAATDLCAILGVFLDNALEAAAAAPSGWVRVYFYQEARQQHIVISNNFLEMPTLARLYKYGYSSKGPGRGLGLPEVKRILRRYPAILHNTCLEKGTFTQELIIPLAV